MIVIFVRGKNCHFTFDPLLRRHTQQQYNNLYTYKIEHIVHLPYKKEHYSRNKPHKNHEYPYARTLYVSGYFSVVVGIVGYLL